MRDDLQLELLNFIGGLHVSLEDEDVLVLIEHQILIFGQDQNLIDPDIHLA